MAPRVKADKTGLHIPKEMINDFPPDTIFRVNRKGTQLVLTPEGLTEKTAGIVEYRETEIDEAFDELISGR